MVASVVLVWIGGRRVDAVPRVLGAFFVETEMKANCLDTYKGTNAEL